MRKITIICAVIFSLFCPLMVKADAGLTEIAGGDSLSNAAGVNFGVDYVSSKDDTVYYMFTTPDAKAFYYLYCKNYTIEYGMVTFRIEVQNKYGEVLATNKQEFEGDEGTVDFQLEPGTTYYIMATGGDGAGNFEFKLTYQEDVVGDTAETSKSISLDKNVRGSIDGSMDQDWYHFMTEDAGDYVLTFKNLNIPNWDDSVYAKVSSKYGEIMGEASWDLDNKGGDVLLKGLSADTAYYVQIGTGKITGNYEFHVSKKREAPSAGTILKLKKVSAKKFKVTWKKDSKASGYEIQYSTSQAFSSAKKKKITNASTTSATVSGLKKGKTYYVRVRAYAGSGSSRLNGIWSDVKRVNLKK